MAATGKRDERLLGKLLLSSALVAVSAGYVYWQRTLIAPRPEGSLSVAALPAPAQIQAPPQAQAAAPAPQVAAPDAAQTASTPSPSSGIAPRAASAPAAMAAPQAQPQQNTLLPASPPPAPAPPPAPLTGLASIQNYIPVEGVSPPLPITTGTPDPGATPPIPAGSHLEDGEYESDKVQFMWGDLRVKIVVAGGKITAVQIVSYPDHRSESLYLIQLADPVLNSEVIKTQQAKVDIVSTATNSSYAYQDAIANAIMKATRE